MLKFLKKVFLRSGTALQWDLLKACLVTLAIAFGLEILLYQPTMSHMLIVVLIQVPLVAAIVLLHPWISGRNVTPLWGIFFADNAAKNRRKQVIGGRL